MKKIGIVGGVAWKSTVDYYSAICRRSEHWRLASNLPGAPSIPEMSIESLDINKAIAYFGADGDDRSWCQFDDYHRTALKRLEASGADFALIASNSPHHRMEAIIRGVGIPVLSIFEVSAKECARMGAREVLILGTSVTMNSPVLREKFSKYGVEASGPDDEATRASTTRLIADLQLGNPDGAAERLAGIVKASLQKQFTSQPLVCLACTELPSAFQELKTLPTFEVEDVWYLNTTVVHANAAFDFAASKTR